MYVVQSQAILQSQKAGKIKHTPRHPTSENAVLVLSNRQELVEN